MYEATGQIVKAQRGYAAFCELEPKLFTEPNSRPKPIQPVHTIGDLLRLAAREAPFFHAVMLSLEADINRAREVPVGGVAYKPAALKRATRIVEKLSLDMEQAAARAARDIAGLDASGVLDVVRGMFVCSSMQHALQLLTELAVRAKAGAFELVRSKNRFSRCVKGSP